MSPLIFGVGSCSAGGEGGGHIGSCPKSGPGKLDSTLLSSDAAPAAGIVEHELPIWGKLAMDEASASFTFPERICSADDLKGNEDSFTQWLFIPIISPF